jgi:threonine/homoserine/homoserine lactone efflux protein
VAFIAFLAQAVLISLSGVMAPGPVTAVTVGKGSRSPHAGALVAVGHGMVEVPLMVAIFYGLGRLIELPHVKAAIGLVGGLLLLAMGADMLRTMNRAAVTARASERSSLVAGMLLSIGSPYFIVWWATIGAALIIRSVGFGLAGFLVFALVHWLCDFVWYYFLSALSFKGGQFFGRIFQKVIFGVCGAALLFFAARFITDAAAVLLT